MRNDYLTITRLSKWFIVASGLDYTWIDFRGDINIVFFDIQKKNLWDATTVMVSTSRNCKHILSKNQVHFRCYFGYCRTSFNMESRSEWFRPEPILASLLETMLPLTKAIMVGTALIENLSQSGLSSSFNLIAYVLKLADSDFVADSNTGLNLWQKWHQSA